MDVNCCSTLPKIRYPSLAEPVLEKNRHANVHCLVQVASYRFENYRFEKILLLTDKQFPACKARKYLRDYLSKSPIQFLPFRIRKAILFALVRVRFTKTFICDMQEGNL